MKSIVGVGRIRNPGFLTAAAFGLFPPAPSADGPPTITPVTIGRTQGFRDSAGTLVIGAEFRVCDNAKGEAAALTIEGERGYIDPAEDRARRSRRAGGDPSPRGAGDGRPER
jgi:hypothetical protein